MLEKAFKTRAFTVICLALLLTCSWAIPQQALANSEEQPKQGIPKRRIGGGTRGQCFSSVGRLMALVPENNLGFTKKAYPNILFYLPPTSSSAMVEFVLQDENRQSVYETTFTKSSAGGIINFSLPESSSLPPLDINKKYNWYVSLICDPENRANDIVVNGWIQRVELDSNLNKQLEQTTSPLGLVALYAKAGLWQDALATLAELRATQPNDSRLAVNWTQLLKTEKLDAIAQEPFLEIQIPNSP
ncbi:hypothetical protein NIES37_42990 [Tolypothrix tenuis PCC 7101]|uniref:DUF928 domain-containing protein n=1 Tax=Tolypothrix tenuis PCC 7101 TaxID=231146 RepID=A0A1Z4N3J1_9CYAN|nr:DUF928 domain-containing protein [Aulosira sp. FACHB-113]BAZ00310.1 hypothetical protein NIES37_42990 [Tolypothrix tenuis PCC 7101]BAZ75769.1 hypothetical protein NIES50_43600 [Aulosira laxa NIES-50]